MPTTVTPIYEKSSLQIGQDIEISDTDDLGYELDLTHDSDEIVVDGVGVAVGLLMEANLLTLQLVTSDELLSNDLVTRPILMTGRILGDDVDAVRLEAEGGFADREDFTDDELCFHENESDAFL